MAHWIFHRNPRREAMLKFYWEAGDSDSQIYGLVVAIGIPLLGMLPALLGTTQSALLTFRLFVMAAFFGLGHLYWCVENGWIDAAIAREGLLETESLNYQRRTMAWPLYGIIIASVLGLVLWVASWSGGFWWWRPRYGTIEVLMLLHTLWVWRSTVGTYGHLYDRYNQMSGTKQRLEQKVRELGGNPDEI